jgi:hypothetical protein
MKPYLKGFHLTLHGWQPGRDDSGWKITTNEVKQDPGDLEFDLTQGLTTSTLDVFEPE